MKRAVIALLGLLLCGCYTPAQIREQGERHDRALRLPPGEAVNCIARNANEYWPGLSASIIGHEVVVRNPETVYAVAAIASGKATIWLGPQTVFMRSMPDAIVKGC